MRPGRYRPSRRTVIVAAVVATLGLLATIALVVVYPRVGASVVRSKVQRVGTKLGRQIEVGAVTVGYGHAVLRDVVVHGPADGTQPLVHVDRVDVDFDFWRSLIGQARLGGVEIDGVQIAVRRDVAGQDNWKDIVTRLRGDRAASGAGGGSLGARPESVRVRHITVDFVDDLAGVFAKIGGGEAELRADHVGKLSLHQLAATTTAGPAAGADEIDVVDDPTAGRAVTVGGGRVSLWPRMALTGIGGTVRDNAQRGRYDVELAGGYGGVDGRLWTARGWLEPATATASIALDADRFTLERLRPLLERSAVLDYGKTSVDASLKIDVAAGLARFAGGFHLHDLTVSHPMIAEKPVPAIDINGDVAGSFDRGGRVLTLERGDFESRGLRFALTGHLDLPGGVLADGTRRVARALDGRLVVPPVPCQDALDAIPPEMGTYLTGFQLSGTFETDVRVAIDWSNLDATVLDGSVGIRKCHAVHAPDDVGKRLQGTFEHYVEVEEGQWVSFIVGPENPDFVPIAEISPHLINSIMSTEDSNFRGHHGFITSEFRSALIKNLKAGAFKYGASSITMQLVKNVLLYREKTLSRKLQELFLTWYIETILPKDRILEIYLNVIEYGPGLYGIGPAAQQFFGKSAHDINPREAAFFSSILPAPKQRYVQYCKGELAKWTADKIDRILGIMQKRGRLTDEEYQQALATPLVFVKDGTETEEDCLKRTKKAIRNARPTNPLKK